MLENHFHSCRNSKHKAKHLDKEYEKKKTVTCHIISLLSDQTNECLIDDENVTLKLIIRLL